MTKQEYLIILQEKLEYFSRELQREIIEDYEEHFAEGLAAGKTEEEIVEELGDIEDMIRELPEEEASGKRLPEAVPDSAQAPEIQSTDISHRYSCPEGKYQAVVIDGLVADVTLEKSEDESVFVHYENNAADGEPRKYRFCQHEKDGVLYLEVKENTDFQGKGSARDRNVLLLGKFQVRFNSISNHEEIKLSVKIPDGLPRAELRTTSGDMTVSRIRVEKFSLTTASGDATVTQTETEQLTVVTASGDLKLLQNKAKQINARAASGDFEIEELACQRLVLNTASGDISAGSLAAEEMSVQTGSGDVRLNTVCLDRLKILTGSGDITESCEVRHRTIQTGSGDIVINPKGEANSVRIDSGSGDVVLDVKEINGVRATVQTGSGDGVIQNGDSRHYVSRGECTVGEGGCQVVVHTGSGDAMVKMQ